MKTQNIFVVVISIFSLTLFIFSSGCNKNDSIVNPVISDINGIIVDDNNNPINNMNIELVVMNDFVITRTLSDGRFHFSNAALPYRLNITSSLHSNSNKFAYIYDGLSENNPRIKIEDYWQNNVQKNALLHIKTPDSVYINDKSYNVAIYDTTGNLFNSFEIDNVFDNNINVYWANETEYFDADIFVLSKYHNYSTSKDYYYNYYEKKAHISNGGIDTVKFNIYEIKNVDENREVTFFHSSGWQITYLNAGLTFNENLLDNRKGIPLTDLFEPSQSAIFPIINGKNLFYYYNIFLAENQGRAAYVWNSRLFPVNSFFLNMKPIPTIVFPPNNFENVNRNTHFNIADGDKTGIYLYNIRTFNTNRTIYLYTKNTGFYYPNIKDTNFQLKKNTNYDWGVVKYYNTENLDILVNSSSNIDYCPSELSNTGQYSFKTKDTL
jgi:hypothetical protein